MTATFQSEDEILHYVYPVVVQREILQQQQILESYTELPEPIKLPSSVICKIKVIALTKVHCSLPSMNVVFSFK